TMLSGTPPRYLRWILLFGTLALDGGIGGQADTSSEERGALKSVLRRPVALVLAENGKWLFVANQRSGSISVIDTRILRAAAEVSVGRKLCDLVATPDERHLLAADEEANQVVLLARQGAALEPVERIPVSAGPVSLQISRDGSRWMVASQWSR